MGSKFIVRLTALVLAVGTAGLAAAKDAEVPQDPKILNYVSRALPWYGDSTFTIKADHKALTPSGAYRIMQVQRRSGNQFFNNTTSVLLDEPGNTLWIGVVGQLPREVHNADTGKLKAFIEEWVPDLLMRNTHTKGRIDWDVKTTGPSAVLHFNLWVDTGYGEYLRPGGVTIDGGLILLGAPFPFDRDPVEYRRELLETSDSVAWGAQR